MAITVVMALIAALILSLTFVPAAVAILLTGKVVEKHNPVMQWASDRYAPLLKWAIPSFAALSSP